MLKIKAELAVTIFQRAWTIEHQLKGVYIEKLPNKNRASRNMEMNIKEAITSFITRMEIVLIVILQLCIP